MNGGFATTKIVIVHRGQVVMDQRIAVHALDGGRGLRRCGRIGIEQGSRLHDQKRPQPLPAIEHSVPHRGQQPFWPRDLSVARALVKDRVERLFHLAGPQRQNRLEIVLSQCVHGAAMAANVIAVKPACADRALRRLAVSLYAVRGSNRSGVKVVEEPEIVVEPRQKKRRAPRRRLRRWLLRGFIALVAIGMLPLALTLLYAVPGVRPVSTLMIVDTLTLRGFDRQWVPLDEMGPNIVNAVTMSEDGQFCFHRGIDVGEFRALVEEALAGQATRGGSTITMQTVKNLYLWHGRSYVRKAIELPLAVYFDAVLSKKRIMEIYLNIAEWAPGVYGAEAGARHHFGVSARQLTPRQAALMAVTLPNPAARNPANPTANLNRVANTIERRARGAGAYVRCLQ